MSGLRLDLIVRRYAFQERPDDVDRWTWRMWSGSRIVSTSGSQLYSRRIDCARGAEIGAGLHDLVVSRCTYAWRPDYREGYSANVEVRIVDEREAKP